MGKNSQIPQVRPKSAIYTSKLDDEHPGHFYMGAPRERAPEGRDLKNNAGLMAMTFVDIQFTEV